MTRPRPRAALALLATLALGVAGTIAAAGPALAAGHHMPGDRPGSGRTLPTRTTVPGTALGVSALNGVVGAKVPFTEYEAENGSTNGTVVGPSRAYTALASEASGRKAVSLAEGQHVDIVLAKAANAVDVRYSVPDGTTSTLDVSTPGENGGALPSLALTSTYAYAYGNYPFTNEASDGGVHHFFDDSRALLGRTLPAGTTVRFTATAAGTVLDLADFEQVAAPTKAPAGSLDAVTLGADPSGKTDSGAALQAAIDQASAAGKTLYIPQGTYQVNQQLVVDKVTVTGAGEWYTTVTGNDVGFFGHAAPTGSTGVHLSNLAIEGKTIVRNDQSSDSGLGGVMGGGSTATDLWIEHTKVGAWMDGPSSGLTLSHLRIQDTWADGINLHDGISHTTVSDTFVRNTGDDGLAMWSDQNADHDNSFTHDTVALPVLANAFAVYGGYGNAVTDDVAADTVTQGGGVQVANRFGSVPLSGTTTVSRDVLVRTGALNPNPPVQAGALIFWAGDEAMDGRIDVSHVTALDSSFAGVQFFGDKITNVHVSDSSIVGGSFAVQEDAAGSATFKNVVALGQRNAGVESCSSGFSIARSGFDLGWSRTTCGLPDAGQLELAQADGIDYGFQSLGSSTTKSLTITNPGPKAITITAVTPPAGFTVTKGCATIAAGASCDVRLAFEPTAAANYSGLLTIDSTSPAGPYVVSLAGVGYDPNGDLALGRTVTTSSTNPNSYYGPDKLTNGDAAGADGYWEGDDGAGFPQAVTVDLGQKVSVDRVVLSLPAGWGTRVENITVSADGTQLVPATDYTFDPSVANNSVTITVPATQVQKLTVSVASNTGWAPAAQLSEIQVYAH
jgi:hypothetical protein